MRILAVVIYWHRNICRSPGYYSNICGISFIPKAQNIWLFI